MGNLATFLFLIFEDAGRVHGIFNWIFNIGANFVLGMIWPVYWGIVRWIA